MASLTLFCTQNTQNYLTPRFVGVEAWSLSLSLSLYISAFFFEYVYLYINVNITIERDKYFLDIRYHKSNIIVNVVSRLLWWYTIMSSFQKIILTLRNGSDGTLWCHFFPRHFFSFFCSFVLFLFFNQHFILLIQQTKSTYIMAWFNFHILDFFAFWFVPSWSY